MADLRDILERLLQRRDLSEAEAAVLARMIVAAGRAVLEQWYDGSLTREEAVRISTRGVGALLQAFARPAGAS